MTLTPTVRRRLRAANLALAAVHALQGALIVALSNGFSIVVTESFAAGPPGTPPGSPEALLDLAIGPAVAAFLFLAAADHLLVALPRVVDRYERNLAERCNLFRWAEYSTAPP